MTGKTINLVRKTTRSASYEKYSQKNEIVKLSFLNDYFLILFQIDKHLKNHFHSVLLVMHMLTMLEQLQKSILSQLHLIESYLNNFFAKRPITTPLIIPNII